jgi:hypothetical protein
MKLVSTCEVRCLKDNDNKKHRGRERGGLLSQRANTLSPLEAIPLSALSADNNCLLDYTLLLHELSCGMM